METEKLAFDSEFFGIPVYRGTFRSQADAAAFRVPEERPCIVYCFADEGLPDLGGIGSVLGSMGAVRYGARMVYGQVLDATLPTQDVTPHIIEDIREIDDDVRRLAIESGHCSRFMKDPVLKSHGRALYERWIETCFSTEGRRVYGCRSDGALAGILATSRKGDITNIELLSVDSAHRRRGVARSLFVRAARDAQAAGAAKMHVATQSDNVEAIAFYSACGFSVVSSVAVWHLQVN